MIKENTEDIIFQANNVVYSQSIQHFGVIENLLQIGKYFWADVVLFELAEIDNESGIMFSAEEITGLHKC